MSVVTAYLNRMVLLRVAVAVIAISLFVLVFDLLDASDDIIRTEGSIVPLLCSKHTLAGVCDGD